MKRNVAQTLVSAAPRLIGALLLLLALAALLVNCGQMKANSKVDFNAEAPAPTQVFSDVDSVYVTLQSAVNLLRPYRDTYLKLATNVRDTMSLAYRNGGASLLDFQDAEKSYRDTRLAYLNLIGSYLTAVGREVIE